MTSADPLRNQVRVMRASDTELRKALRDAAREADRILRALGDDMRPGAQVTRTRMELARLNTEMWLTINDDIRDGIGVAFDESSRWQAKFDKVLFDAIKLDIPNWSDSLVASSRQGLPNYLARKHDGYTLSQRVYRNSALSKGYVDRAINNALLLGKTPRQLADDVRKYISPDTPGGASYSAMRLGRTEVVNAYHRNAVTRYQQTPWIDKVKWNLSGSHPRPDECNEYAESGDLRGAGVWSADNVPAKPHPQCLCYVTPIQPSLDEFVNRYKSGEFDEYIDSQIGLLSAA
jgi:hypothetical protein